MVALVHSGVDEYGSYFNPNRTPYDKCEISDLVKLSECSNDVLHHLDKCKAEDLACECCALQSISSDCYGLCTGDPSANFLGVLLNDCSTLNDVNACSLPFKKTDAKLERSALSNKLELGDFRLKSKLGEAIQEPIPSSVLLFDTAETKTTLDSNKSPVELIVVNGSFSDSKITRNSSELELISNISIRSKYA